MKKTLLISSSVLTVLILTYMLGPVTDFAIVNPKIQALDIPLETLDAFVASNESKVATIKPENASRIIWHNGIKKTEYAMVYLHGFSAGIMESDPIHESLATKYGSNLYLARLSQHGISDPDAFLTLTPKSLIESAKEAIAIGQLIGDKVILISCSTGGTLSIYLTAHNPELVHSQILYSPNTAIDDPASALFNRPWGKQILKLILGDFKKANDKWRGTKVEEYWTLDYRVEGLVALQALLELTMTDETYSKISSPYFAGYYFKNKEESDHVISVPGILNFDSKTTTPENLKVLHAFPNVKSHVIASDLQSKDIQAVFKHTSAFIEEVLKIEPYTAPEDSTELNAQKMR